MPKPSTSHIGKGVALVAWTAALVYIYAWISQIAEIHTSFYVTGSHGNYPLQVKCIDSIQTTIKQTMSYNVS